MTPFYRIFQFLLCVLICVAATAQTTEKPNAVASHELTKFSHIKILDTTKLSSGPHRLWGYPGIWIKQTDDRQAKITYNNVCTPYISTEIEGDTLVVKLDQDFLNPLRSNWKNYYGMIRAISIEVPKQFGLASIYNDSGYQFNTSLMNFD